MHALIRCHMLLISINNRASSANYKIMKSIATIFIQITNKMINGLSFSA